MERGTLCLLDYESAADKYKNNKNKPAVIKKTAGLFLFHRLIF